MAVQRLVFGEVYCLEDSAAIKLIDIITSMTEEERSALLEFLTVYYFEKD